MSRRAMAGLAVAVLVAGCGGDDTTTSSSTTTTTEAPSTSVAETTTTTGSTTTTVTPTTTATSTTSASGADEVWAIETFDPTVDDDLPVIVVSGADGVVVSDGTTSEPLVALADLAASGSVGRVLGDGRGRFVAETTEVLADDETPTPTGLVLVDGPDAAAEELDTSTAAVLGLQDLVVVDDEAWVIWTSFPDLDDVETPSSILVSDPTGGFVDLGEASASEYFVHRASASIDTVAVSAFADLTELVTFVDFTGREIARPGPTDDLGYNQPPLVVEAVLSDDGSEVAFIEGPDVDGADPDGAVVGDWDVVVDDVEGEQMRLTVASADVDDINIDFDGRWLVVSARDDGAWHEPIVIDTESVSLPAFRIGGVTGIAMLDHAPEVARSEFGDAVEPA